MLASGQPYILQETYKDHRWVRGVLSEAERKTIDRELIDACIKGDNDEIDMLLSEGASENARDGYGDTALLICAAYGHTDSAVALMFHRASPIISNRGYYPISTAISSGFTNTADAIYRYTPRPLFPPKMRMAIVEGSWFARRVGLQKTYEWALRMGLI